MRLLRPRARQEGGDGQRVVVIADIGEHWRRRRGGDAAGWRDLDLRRVRKLESADDIDRGVMALDQGGCTGIGPMTAVDPVGVLDSVFGADGGKARINRRTSHLAPPSVAFEGRQNARLYWVS